MKKIFEEFKKLKVLVVGDLMLDKYYFSEVERISPEVPVPIARIIDEKNIVGGAISGILLLFGCYLTFFDKTQKILAEHQIKITSALKSSKKEDRQKEEFNAYLSGFDDEQQKILKIIKEQEGITQSTLRLKTTFSKTKLSLILKLLEDRKIINRKNYKKTKKIYLIQRF